jgi:hypothetical protein
MKININDDVSKEYPWREDQVWEKRTREIAKIIPRRAEVLDLGGGLGHLYRYLKDASAYLSFDTKKWHSMTVEADFNKGEYPKTSTTFQFLVCQGLLEYIKDPQEFLVRIQQYGDMLVLTYRRANGEWTHGRVNDLDFDKVKVLLRSVGWDVVFSKSLIVCKKQALERIYLCRLNESNV